MSKFAEVFEKMQDRRRPKLPVSAVKDKSSYAKITQDQLKQVDSVNWEQKIQTMKNTDPQEHVVMLRHPDSMPAEQYRMLRTSLKAELDKHNAKVIMLTSSFHSEGKTVTSSNLALCLAEDKEKRVLLIDCDLRRGHVAQYLGFGKKPGISEMFTEDMNPRKVMIKNSVPNLVVIPSGKPFRKPSEIITSDKFQTLITSLREHFDYILIDSPPVMAAADTCMMAKLVDAVVFVIQLGRTPKPVIAHAHQLLEQAGAKVLGHILTHVEFSSSEYRYYDYYGYDQPRNKKEQRALTIRKYAMHLRDLEDRFNGWWERKVHKKQPLEDRKQKREDKDERVEERIHKITEKIEAESEKSEK